ncbi:MAG: low molecular weight phosphotyrosine protein phosphatase [Clostridia bacterium]|jgi:protein-tyrosine phosphatase|nr:low molecular weight phosphotyrosine protein phosphatase [Clostridia bacterium]
MLKIIFVCHGNICRSPSAEILLKKMIKEEGVEDRFFVSSAATSTEEIFNGIGNPIYPPMAAELRRHGLSTEGKRAVQLTAADLEKYDMFIGMDSANVRNMKRILGEGSESKISKLMEYTERGGDVADPWYSERFDVAFYDIEEGCRALLDLLLAKGY